MVTTSRQSSPIQNEDSHRHFTLNCLNEDELSEVTETFKTDSLAYVFYCVGTLTDDVTKPEKSLRDIDMNRLTHSFQVNAVGFAILSKHLEKVLKKDSPTKIVAISAKVGSIGDNELGGWYGYRASKAALNMFVRNTAIEFGRNNYQTSVYAIHPGTTITDLSDGYLKNTKLKVHTAEETAENIYNVVESLDAEQSGEFFSWDGSKLPF